MDLPFRSFVAGSGVSISFDADSITISATGSGSGSGLPSGGAHGNFLAWDNNTGNALWRDVVAGDIISGVFAVAQIPDLPISKITGLQAALNTKDSLDDLSNVTTTGAAPNDLLWRATGGQWESGSLVSGTGITIDGRTINRDPLGTSDIPNLAISKITGLQTALDAKLENSDVKVSGIISKTNDGTGIGFTLGVDADSIAPLFVAGTGISIARQGDNIEISSSQSGTGGATALNGLTDVALSGVATGQMLIYGTDPSDATMNKWTNVSLTGDVTISTAGVTSIGTARVRTANLLDNAVTSSKIGPAAVDADAVGFNLGDVGQVTISNPSTGHVLRYNGTTWVNAAISMGDLDITGEVANDILIYDGTNWGPHHISGDATMTSAGALTIADSAITTAKIAVGTAGQVLKTIDDGNGNLSVQWATDSTGGGGGTIDSLNDIGDVYITSAADHNILIFSNGGWRNQAVGGDADIINDGTLTIRANAITNSKIAAGTILNTNMSTTDAFALIFSRISSDATNLPDTGKIRLGHSNAIAWRNNDNDGNLVLGVTSSDKLEFNGNPIAHALGDLSDVDLTGESDDDYLIRVSGEWTPHGISGDIATDVNTPGQLTIRNGVVTSAKIAAGTIRGTDIASATITSLNLGSASVGTAQLAANIAIDVSHVSQNVPTGGAGVSDSGVFRLRHGGTVSWRNSDDDADLALGVNSENNLTFKGNVLAGIGNISMSDLSDVGYGPGTSIPLAGLNQVLIYNSSNVWVPSLITTGSIATTGGSDGQVLTISGSAVVWADSTGGGGSGEANTGLNLGFGSRVYQGKSGVTLRFRSIIGGDSITVTQGTDALTIDLDDLPTSKITSGTFDQARIPILTLAHITPSSTSGQVLKTVNGTVLWANESGGGSVVGLTNPLEANLDAANHNITAVQYLAAHATTSTPVARFGFVRMTSATYLGWYPNDSGVAGADLILALGTDNYLAFGRRGGTVNNANLIKDGNIGTAKLADGSVTGGKIANFTMRSNNFPQSVNNGITMFFDILKSDTDKGDGTAGHAQSGSIQFAHGDFMAWRNNGDDGDLTLGVNASNQLTFNGTAVGGTSGLQNLQNIDQKITWTNTYNGPLNNNETGISHTYNSNEGHITFNEGHNVASVFDFSAAGTTIFELGYARLEFLVSSATDPSSAGVILRVNNTIKAYVADADGSNGKVVDLADIGSGGGGSFDPQAFTTLKQADATDDPAASTTGIGLKHSSQINWRNFANTANLALAVNGSDQLTWGGVVISGGGTGLANLQNLSQKITFATTFNEGLAGTEVGISYQTIGSSKHMIFSLTATNDAYEYKFGGFSGPVFKYTGFEFEGKLSADPTSGVAIHRVGETLKARVTRDIGGTPTTKVVDLYDIGTGTGTASFTDIESKITFDTSANRALAANDVGIGTIGTALEFGSGDTDAMLFRFGSDQAIKIMKSGLEFADGTNTADPDTTGQLIRVSGTLKARLTDGTTEKTVDLYNTGGWAGDGDLAIGTHNITFTQAISGTDYTATIGSEQNDAGNDVQLTIDKDVNLNGKWVRNVGKFVSDTTPRATTGKFIFARPNFIGYPDAAGTGNLLFGVHTTRDKAVFGPQADRDNHILWQELADMPVGTANQVLTTVDDGAGNLSVAWADATGGGGGLSNLQDLEQKITFASTYNTSLGTNEIGITHYLDSTTNVLELGVNSAFDRIEMSWGGSSGIQFFSTGIIFETNLNSDPSSGVTIRRVSNSLKARVGSGTGGSAVYKVVDLYDIGTVEDGSITTAKLADGAVDSAKLSGTADDGITMFFSILKSSFSDSDSPHAQSGSIQLTKDDFIAWRNNDNSGDLDLRVNSSNQLTFNGTVLGAAAQPSSLNSLSDVTISSPSNGQILQYNGTAWVNATTSPGGGLTNLQGLAQTITFSATFNTSISGSTGISKQINTSNHDTIEFGVDHAEGGFDFYFGGAAGITLNQGAVYFAHSHTSNPSLHGLITRVGNTIKAYVGNGTTNKVVDLFNIGSGGLQNLQNLDQKITFSNTATNTLGSSEIGIAHRLNATTNVMEFGLNSSADYFLFKSGGTNFFELERASLIWNVGRTSDPTSGTRISRVDNTLKARVARTISGSVTYKVVDLYDISTSGGATTLGGLSDVTISSPSANQILQYNGTAWVNANAPSGGGLSNLQNLSQKITFAHAFSSTLAAGETGITTDVAQTMYFQTATLTDAKFQFTLGTQNVFRIEGSSIYFDYSHAGPPASIGQIKRDGDTLKARVSDGATEKTVDLFDIGTGGGAGLANLQDLEQAITWDTTTSNTALGSAETGITTQTFSNGSQPHMEFNVGSRNGRYEFSLGGTANVTFIGPQIRLDTTTDNSSVNPAAGDIILSRTDSNNKTIKAGVIKGGTTRVIDLQDIPTDGELDGLSNVTISSLATNQMLQWNGTAWVNVNAPSGGGLSNLQNLNQIITWADGSNVSMPNGDTGINVDLSGSKADLKFWAATTSGSFQWFINDAEFAKLNSSGFHLLDTTARLTWVDSNSQTIGLGITNTGILTLHVGSTSSSLISIIEDAGTTGESILGTKTANTQQLKLLEAGTGISITDNTDRLTLAASGGGGSIQSMKSLGRAGSTTTKNYNDLDSTTGFPSGKRWADVWYVGNLPRGWPATGGLRGCSIFGNRVYCITVSLPYRVIVYDLNGNEVPSEDFNLHTDNGNAAGIVRTSSGFYVVDQIDDKVYVYDLDGTYSRNFDIDSDITATSITFANNRLYIGDLGRTNNRYRIWAYGTDGTRHSSDDITLPSSIPAGPYGLDFYNNKIYCVIGGAAIQSNSLKVIAVSTDGVEDTTVGFDLAPDSTAPAGLAVTDDFIYVLDSGDSRMYVYTHDGSYESATDETQWNTDTTMYERITGSLKTTSSDPVEDTFEGVKVLQAGKYKVTAHIPLTVHDTADGNERHQWGARIAVLNNYVAGSGSTLSTARKIIYGRRSQYFRNNASTSQAGTFSDREIEISEPIEVAANDIVVVQMENVYLPGPTDTPRPTRITAGEQPMISLERISA